MADDLPEGPALLGLCVQQLQIWALPIIGQEPARRVVGHGAVVVGVAVVRVDDHASRVGAAHGGDQLPAVGHWEGGEGKRNLKTETLEGKRSFSGERGERKRNLSRKSLWERDNLRGEEKLEGGKRRWKEKLERKKLEGKRRLRQKKLEGKRNLRGESGKRNLRGESGKRNLRGKSLREREE